MSRRPRLLARAALLLAVLAATRAAHGSEVAKPLPGPLPTETSCVKCHSELDGEYQEPTKHIGEDVHFGRALSCHNCHGGDPTAGFDGDMDAAHSRAKGWTGKPARKDIPAFCAKCHADPEFMKRFDPHTRVDQLSEYLTSGHGRRLKTGDDKVAVCIDCHGAHGIRKVSDPQSTVHPTRLADTCARCHADKALMSAYGLPSTPPEDYRTSVHAKALYDNGDLSAPTCNDCHGSHGATPPGVGNVSAVCGSCHTREATLFRETEAKRRIDLSDCSQCMVCHSNHAVLKPTDEMLGVGPHSTCTTCHSAGDTQYAAADTMAKSLAEVEARLAEARGLLDGAARAGVEVGPDLFKLQEARDHLVEARVLAHSFDLERFKAATDAGLKVAVAGVDAGHHAYDELHFRRNGLWLFLVVVVAVMIALAFKARELSRQDPA
jgi:hypothetical protein